ncbi:MAG: polyprenol monophosphomannose synthase [Gemmatimonadota bacterium]
MSGNGGTHGNGDERFLVVIPTYNERRNVSMVVPLVAGQDPRVHVLIVDDNSPDGTGQEADRLARDNPRIHVLHREGKGGLGQAYIAGFKWGLERDFALFFEMDADLSHPADQIPAFIAKSAECDVIVGSRYVGGRVAVVNWPLSRLMLSLFGSLYARVITRLPLSDATGGFNCFKREVLEAIDVDRIQSTGYTFQIELKLRAWRKGFRVCEIPVIFTERAEGESKMSKRIVREAVWRVWQLRLMDLFGRL